MKNFFRYLLILCLAAFLAACSPASADGEKANLEDDQNPTMTDMPQEVSESSEQESVEDTELRAEAEQEQSSAVEETEGSELDAIPRWTFAEISNAKAGDIVTYGTYEQDNDPENGTEPIEWFLLEMEDDRAVLLSVYLLDCQRYHTEDMEMTWEDCAMRAWLNDDFLNTAFTKAEQEHIVVTKLVNEDNPAYGTRGGNDTSDKIWLLSFEDVEKYFDISVKDGKNPYIKDNMTLDGYGKYCYDQDHRALAKPTAYAIKQGCVPFDIEETVEQAKKRGTSDALLEKLRTELEEFRYASGGARWWLRSPGKMKNWAVEVTNSGSVPRIGIFVNVKSGVRPALTVTY